MLLEYGTKITESLNTNKTNIVRETFDQTTSELTKYPYVIW